MPNVKKGFVISSKDNGEQYTVTAVGAMISYSGDAGEGEVSAAAFESEFEVVQPDVTIHARITGVDCPYCNTKLDGFLSDPRGTDVECDECGKVFQVPLSAEVSLD